MLEREQCFGSVSTMIRSLGSNLWSWTQKALHRGRETGVPGKYRGWNPRD
ncbi:rCG51859, partial [Rattus norvegicus]